MTHSTISKTAGEIESGEGLPIYYDLYVPAGKPDTRYPVILFLHGFKGFKDWGPFPDACWSLADAGFCVVALNFSHNGVGKNMYEFDELELFAEETLSRDLDDVGSVIEALNSGEIDTDKAGLIPNTIGILGHSRGGQTAVAAAAEYIEISCLVTWSAVADYNARWSDEMISDWESKGYTEIPNTRTGQIMRVNRSVYDDARENADRVIALNRIEDIYLPALFVHAKGDESVPFKDSVSLFRNCPSDDKELRLVPDSGHTFGTGHPFEDEEFPEPFSTVLRETREWFEFYLKK